MSFTHVIMRDNAYDMVAFQEMLKYGRASGVQLGDYDIEQYAGAFGATGIRVHSIDEFEDVFKQSLSETGVTIIDVPVDYTRNSELHRRRVQTSIGGRMGAGLLVDVQQRVALFGDRGVREVRQA